MTKKERCFCGSGKASKNCHRATSDSRAAHLFRLFNKIEQTVETYFESKEVKPQCYTGCNNCCSDFFAVSEVELEIIMDEIYNTWTEEDISRLYRRVNDNVRAFQTEHPDLDSAIRTQLDYEGNLANFKSFKGGKSRTSFPCPLINEVDGKCSIYNKRPLICRTHGTSHYELDKEMKALESAICEHIPSRLQNKEVTPDVTDFQKQYEDIVNVSTEKGSLYLRKLPIFYGIQSLAAMQRFNPAKQTVANRHNLDIPMQESNQLQLKKASSLR
ncbi:Putative zinc-or iron-chelating domain-containing protein [Paenibacillus sp. 1_12]|uniref:YkgJ family cysteine cluster protein n=1 Tax=Paenibacillus sp. 1_12 TaxID=1566278 RepID=UPI0008EBC73A|nr:YkgJ family cysteine cluster protein [Paenibacillus sp. 1_12]SFM42187.1 Putative zinc-or iron-chelating domain-containing protein [Paenibacillus sp. 1_12]